MCVFKKNKTKAQNTCTHTQKRRTHKTQTRKQSCMYKRLVRQKMPKQSNVRQKNLQKALLTALFVLCCQTWGSTFTCGFYSETTLGKKLEYFSLQAVILELMCTFLPG